MQIDLNYTVDIAYPIKPQDLKHPLYYLDSGAHVIRVTLLRNGVPLTLTEEARCFGFFLHEATEVTDMSEGTVSDGNVLEVTIPELAYATPGVIYFTIRVTDDGATTTVLAITGNVRSTISGTVIDVAGTLLPNLEELIAAFNRLEEISDSLLSVIDSSAVRYDSVQTLLTDAQKETARENIDATRMADVELVTYSGETYAIENNGVKASNGTNYTTSSSTRARTPYTKVIPGVRYVFRLNSLVYEIVNAWGYDSAYNDPEGVQSLSYTADRKEIRFTAGPNVWLIRVAFKKGEAGTDEMDQSDRDAILSAISLKSCTDVTLSELNTPADSRTIKNAMDGVNSERNLVNYGYDYGSYIKETQTHKYSVSRVGTRLTLHSSAEQSGASYLKISGTICRYTSASTLSGSDNGVALKEGHTYIVRAKLIDGSVNCSNPYTTPYVSVYELGSSSTLGNVRNVSGIVNNIWREFTAGSENVIVAFNTPDGVTYNNAVYEITLKDLTAAQIAEIAPQDRDMAFASAVSTLTSGKILSSQLGENYLKNGYAGNNGNSQDILVKKIGNRAAIFGRYSSSGYRYVTISGSDFKITTSNVVQPILMDGVKLIQKAGRLYRRWVQIISGRSYNSGSNSSQLRIYARPVGSEEAPSTNDISPVASNLAKSIATALYPLTTDQNIVIGKVYYQNDLSSTAIYATEVVLHDETASASNAYEVGDCFVNDASLYRATASIAIGDEILPGTNCESTTPEAEEWREYIGEAAYPIRTENIKSYDVDTEIAFGFFLRNAHYFVDDFVIEWGIEDITEKEPFPVSGTAPNITALTGARYICGTLNSLTFTPSESGICSVRFKAGSNMVLPLFPDTVKMPDWWSSSSIIAGRTYEISIADGVYGVVTSWA